MALSRTQTVAASQVNGDHTTNTKSITLVSGDNLIIARAEYNSFSGNRTMSMTWNGTAMTSLGNYTYNGTVNDEQEVFYLLTPDVGTYNCVLTMSGTVQTSVIQAVVYTDADSVTAINQQTGSASPLSLTPSATTAADDIILSFVSIANAHTTVTATGSTSKLSNGINSGDYTGGNIGLFGLERTATGSGQDNTATTDVDTFYAQTFTIKPSAGGGISIPVVMNQLRNQGIL